MLFDESCSTGFDIVSCMAPIKLYCRRFRCFCQDFSFSRSTFPLLNVIDVSLRIRVWSLYDLVFALLCPNLSRVFLRHNVFHITVYCQYHQLLASESTLCRCVLALNQFKHFHTGSCVFVYYGSCFLHSRCCAGPSLCVERRAKSCQRKKSAFTDIRIAALQI